MAQTTPTQTIGFALVGGAGLDDWVWKNVITNLKCPSMVIHFSKAHSTDGMSVYTEEAKAQLAHFNVDKVVVVGHSLGGTIGLSVAQTLGDRLAGFIAISATIPKNGGSFFSALPMPQKFIMPLIVRFAGTRPSDKILAQGYCNDLSAEVTQQVIQNYRPETRQIYSDKSAPVPQDVPKLYIKTTNDPEMSDAFQQLMAKNLGAGQTAQIATGHLPMLGKPQELADMLNRFVDSQVLL